MMESESLNSAAATSFSPSAIFVLGLSEGFSHILPPLPLLLSRLVLWFCRDTIYSCLCRPSQGYSSDPADRPHSHPHVLFIRSGSPCFYLGLFELLGNICGLSAPRHTASSTSTLIDSRRRPLLFPSLSLRLLSSVAAKLPLCFTQNSAWIRLGVWMCLYVFVRLHRPSYWNSGARPDGSPPVVAASPQ